MHRTTLESIVEIFTVRRDTVDKGSACGVQGALMADRSARSVIVPARKRASDVILVAGGDAQADHVDQQILAFARSRRRESARLQRNDFIGKRFGDRSLWQLGYQGGCRRVKRGRSWQSAP